MRWITALSVLLTGLLGCGALPLQARDDDPLEAVQKRVIEVSQRVKPAVVHVEAAVKVNSSRREVTGSGFIIDPRGIVLTNEHVVERAEKVSVIIPDRPGRVAAEVVGTDKQTDVAVLRMDWKQGDPPFPTIPLGDSDRVQVGEWVIAIGNPYGLEGTVSLGIVSAKGRDLEAGQLLNDFIQTDAMIDRGSSGGPLVNIHGQVIGINSRGQGRGIGFTIPINVARRAADDLLGSGTAERAYLGVSIQPLPRELASYWKIPEIQGVVVNSVAEGSAAARAGLQVGDIITRFDGEAVHAEKDEDTGQFQRLVAQNKVGKTVAVEVLRSGKPTELEAKLEPQPKVVPDEEETEFGFTVQEITERLYRQHRLELRDGVLISFVEPGTEAAESGLAPGDVITRIDAIEIATIEDFRRALQGLSPARPFLVHVRRGADLNFLLVQPRADRDHAASNGGESQGG